MKENLINLIEQTFNREGSPYSIYWLIIRTTELLNDIVYGHIRKFVTLSIIFWKTFVLDLALK